MPNAALGSGMRETFMTSAIPLHPITHKTRATQASEQMRLEKPMLSIRTRGKNGIYYIRGVVSLGDKQTVVKEFNSGTSDRDAAAHLMAEHETKLRHRLMFGPATVVAQGTIAAPFPATWQRQSPPALQMSCGSASSMA